MRLVGDLEARHYQIKDAKLHSGNSFPVDVQEGQLFYRTDLHEIYYYNGANWVQLLVGSGGGGGGVGSGHVTTLIVDATTDIGRHLYIRDEMITINYGESGSGISQWGTIKSGIEVDRGTENTVSLFFDDGTDRWMLTNDGVTDGTIVVDSDVNYFLRLDGSNTPSSDISWNSHKITDVADPTNPQDVATKNYVDSNLGPLVFLRTDGSNSPTTDISWGSHKITSLASPVFSTDAANKQYVDDQFTQITGLGYNNYLKLDGSNKPTADIDWNSNHIINLSDPTNAQDAATKNYIDTNISNLSTVYLALDGSNNPTHDINWGGYKLIGLSDPSSAQDAVTKNYVDSNFSSISHTHAYNTITGRPSDDDFYVTLTEKNTTSDNDYLLIYSIADGQYMKVKRSTLLSGSATPTSNLDVWTIGGYDGSTHLQNVDAYNSSSDSWTSLVSDLSAPARSSFQGYKLNNSIYVENGFNGATFSYNDKYDIPTDSWSRETDTPNPSRMDNFVVGDGTNYIYTLNGYNSTAGYMGDVDKYDSSGLSWTSMSDDTLSRSSAVSGYITSKIYTVNGYDGTNYLASTTELDTTSDTWSSKTDSSISRRDASGDVLNNKLYVFAGINGSGLLRDALSYDPSSDAWSVLADMALPARTDLSATTYSTYILITGGFDGTNYLRDTDEYDSASDSWVSKVNMPTPARQNHASA